MNNKSERSTRSIHAGSSASNWTHSPLVAPLYLTSTYETLKPGQADYEYSRSNNPTRAELEKYLAELESADYALSFSTGLGALTTTTFLINSGQHVLCSDDVYGGTNRFFSHCAPRMGIETTFVDGTIVQNWVDKFIPGRTKLVWIESPTNPTMKISDIKSIVKRIKLLDEGCIIVVDNTFMTPVFQSPLKMGADIVMHSCTKYINGHSDLLMGALMTNNKGIYERLKFLQNALGIVPSALDCWLVIRSIKTLHVRVKQQASSAHKIANFLEKHKFVERVIYPGLESHPQHELAKKDYSGFGGMIAFYVKTIKGDEATRILQACKIFHMAVSLGCVCSLIQIPSLMTHSGMPKEEKDSLGMTDNLIRLSVGLEDPEDLMEDLDTAINSAYRARL